MNGVWSPQPTHLLVRILFLLVKGVISFAVWLAAVSEKYFAKVSLDHTNSHPEPQYVTYLLGLRFLRDDGKVILGDVIEHYRRICKDRSRREGDVWLFDEIVESLLRLMLRRAFLSGVWTSIGSIFGALSSPRKLFGISNTAAGFLGLTHWSRHPLTRRLAPLTLFVLALTSVLFRQPLSIVQNVEKSPDQHISSNEGPLNYQNGEVFARNPTESATSTRNPTTTNRRQVSKAGSGAVSPISDDKVALMADNGTREPESQKSQDRPGEQKDTLESKPLPQVLNKKTRFSVPLPKGSRSGLYEVTLQDSDGKPLVTLQVYSRDGKSLHPVLDMKRFGPNEYRFSVPKPQKKEEVPNFYRFRIDKK